MFHSKSVLFTIILPAFLILLVPYFLVGGRLDFLGSMAGSWVRMLGLPLFGAGVILVLLGAGTALVASASANAPAGLFRYTRNPIMLGVLLAVGAQYLLYDWPPIIAYLAVLYVASDCLIRLTIEPRLVASQGTAYQGYLESVPRWLPRWRGGETEASRP